MRSILKRTVIECVTLRLRPVRPDLYKERNKIERFFGCLGSRLIKLDPEPEGCEFDNRQEVA